MTTVKLARWKSLEFLGTPTSPKVTGLLRSPVTVRHITQRSLGTLGMMNMYVLRLVQIIDMLWNIARTCETISVRLPSEMGSGRLCAVDRRVCENAGVDSDGRGCRCWVSWVKRERAMYPE